MVVFSISVTQFLSTLNIEMTKDKVFLLLKGWSHLKKGGKSYPCIFLLWPALLNLGGYFGSLDHHDHNDHCYSAP